VDRAAVARLVVDCRILDHCMRHQPSRQGVQCHACQFATTQPLPIVANRIHWAVGPEHSPNGRHPAWRRQRGDVAGWSWGEQLPRTRRVVGHVQGCPRACQGSGDLGQGPIPITDRWRPNRHVVRDRRVRVAPYQRPITRAGRARLP